MTRHRFIMLKVKTNLGASDFEHRDYVSHLYVFVAREWGS